MKIRCIKIDSRDFDLNYVTTITYNQFDYSFGGHSLNIGNEYLVMGIVTYADSPCPYYLIDTNGLPDLYPSLLFDVVDNSLPYSWYACIYNNKDSNISAIYGFKELCNDVDFYDKLMDRDEKVMRIYFRRKIELEKKIAEQFTE
jgi:hypothetical protein